MAKRRNSIVVHCPQIYQILGFLLILILLAAVLSTYRGLLILKVDCPCWSARQRLPWIRLGNLLAWWSRCLLLKVKCLIWWQRLFILKSATLSWLKLSNQHVSSCNVSFLKPPSAFCCVLVVSYALISYSSGICLNPVDEARWVSERVATLERVSSDTNTFLIDPRPCSAIVLLQDRV
jgi:hypothetical protein